MLDRSPSLFIGAKDQRNPTYVRPIMLSPPSHHYGSPGAYAFGAGLPASSYLNPSGEELALPRLPAWLRNINLIPFRQLPVRRCLRTGSLTAEDHCRETLALPAERILTSLRYYCRRDLHLRQVQWTSRPTFCPTGAPPYQVSPMDPPVGSRRPA